MIPASNHNYKVLILDDSPDDIILYRRRLSVIDDVNFDISEAQNIKNAKDKAESTEFDCYIVDYKLSNENGLDFVKYLLDRKTSAAIVVVTGYGDEALAVSAFKLGAHEYLTKSSVLEGSLARPVLNSIERAHLTAQISKFQKKLEKSNEELSNFAHTAAHDLKAPLRRILSYCEILQEEAEERLNQDDKAMLSRMEVNARRMQKLVESLLSFSLIGYDVEKKEVTDLNTLVQDVTEDLGIPIQETQTQIKVENTLPRIDIYPLRIHQLFLNLISNAIKYKSDKAPEIIVGSKTEDNVTTFWVKDNGTGIPEGRHSYIFEDFKRLCNNEKIDGTGLGLSICKRIVEYHDGKIWVESNTDQGVTFFFTIKHS